MLVTAIDNGPMAESLMDTGLVQHLMADGFTWRPKQPVDWMVCDIVEKPAHPSLIETWLGEAVPRGGGQPEAADEAALCRVRACSTASRRRSRRARSRYRSPASSCTTTVRK
jgi:hypothetical protein